MQAVKNDNLTDKQIKDVIEKGVYIKHFPDDKSAMKKDKPADYLGWKK